MLPELSAGLQAFIRSAYGALLLLTLIAALPHARRYFFSEKHGGYTQSGLFANALQHPAVASIWLAAWCVSASALIIGTNVVPAAAFNLVTCYYFFNRLRWTSLSRGMGAPGFIAMWLGAAVFLLELTSAHMTAARQTALLVLQVDFALIMLSAGLYKLAAGYRDWNGMELGMANPEWGYLPSFWKRWPPRHGLFRFLNEMAWGTEIVCGLLMLIPATRWAGGAGIALSFVFILTQIRLGFLCEMVIVCCLLFFAPGTLVDQWIGGAWMNAGLPLAQSGAQFSATTIAAFTAACWIYLALLPVVRAGMFYNQLMHRRLPALLQRALDAYANTFGLILWRVFTTDVVNFFVRIWEPASGSRREITNFRQGGFGRFSQVAECIALTSVFTTLKYFPSNGKLFEDKLVRYARTIPRQSTEPLIFEWVHVLAESKAFAYVPVAEFVVDPERGSVHESTLSNHFSVRAGSRSSPLHEGARPGSYAPLGQRSVS